MSLAVCPYVSTVRGAAGALPEIDSPVCRRTRSRVHRRWYPCESQATIISSTKSVLTSSMPFCFVDLKLPRQGFLSVLSPSCDTTVSHLYQRNLPRTRIRGRTKNMSIGHDVLTARQMCSNAATMPSITRPSYIHVCVCSKVDLPLSRAFLATLA